jgi:hypothetical protein
MATGKFLPSLSAGMVACAAITTISLGAGAAEECLTKPKDETPAGKRWYYRTERDTKRRCWYLREPSETAPQVATSRPIRLAPPDAAPERETELARSAADAHAELPSPPVTRELKPASSRPTTSVSPRAPEQSLSNNAASPENVGAAVVSRWPDLTSEFSSEDRPRSASFVIASAAPDASLEMSAEPYSAAPTPPAVPTEVKTAASVPTGWLHFLLLGTFGAVAISWLLGGSLTARRRRRRRRPILNSPGWPRGEPADRTSIPPQDSRLDPEIKAWSPSSGLHETVLGDHSREIVELLARFANQEDLAERA